MAIEKGFSKISEEGLGGGGYSRGEAFLKQWPLGACLFQGVRSIEHGCLFKEISAVFVKCESLNLVIQLSIRRTSVWCIV